MSKEKTNEGLFGTAKKFSDSFFNGLQKNTHDKFIQHRVMVLKALTDKRKRLEKKELDA